MNPSNWPDGTPRSQGNAFTVTQDGRQIDWKPLLANERLRTSSAATMAKRRAAGTAVDFRGMSVKSDLLRNPHGGAYSMAKTKEQKS